MPISLCLNRSFASSRFLTLGCVTTVASKEGVDNVSLAARIDVLKAWLATQA